MRTVGLKTLKNRLSEYVRLAADGETVLITDRHRVVAEMSAPGQSGAENIPEMMLAEAVRKGWITPASTGAEGPPPRKPVAPARDILSDLQDSRQDR